MSRSWFKIIPLCLIISCASKSEEMTEENSMVEKVDTDSTNIDTAIIDLLDDDLYKESATLKNLGGRWACDCPIINDGLDPDIDGLFDVEELYMSRSSASLEDDFNGLVFWLEGDSTVKVATNYRPSDESKPYNERYSTSYFKKSVWHYRSNGKLILEFVFNDGIDEISKIHYQLLVKDNRNIKLVNTKNEFYFEGEEDN